MVGPSRSGQSDEETRIGYQIAGLGFEVASTVGGGALLGWIFDHYRGTEPTGLLVGSLIGLAVGLFTFIRGALLLNRRLEAAAKKRNRDRTSPAAPPPAGKPETNGDEEDDWDRRWRDKWDDHEDDDHGN